MIIRAVLQKYVILKITVSVIKCMSETSRILTKKMITCERSCSTLFDLISQSDLIAFSLQKNTCVTVN